MKQHLEEEDLILHFYGETGSAAEPHLSDCSESRGRYQALVRVLNSVELENVPHRASEYEDQIWNRLEPKLGRRTRWSSWFALRRWVPAFAAVAVLVIAFLAGRYSPRDEQQQLAGQPSAVRERVLLVAVGDHLERSKMLLVELANADPSRKLAIADEREIAQDLVHTNRLYRQTAVSAGDERVVSLLDQLERVLVEIAHSPDELPPAQLESLRDQIKEEHLIFKIRVAGSKLAQEETL
jgi:hypothetical protein